MTKQGNIMAATGLNEDRLAKAFMDRMKADIGAKETDEQGNVTALRKVATLIAQEVIKELRKATVTGDIPSQTVVVAVTGGGGAPAIGVANPAPIKLSGELS